ncbi:MAG: prepilin-type N-terminal cleavage/methylation domain-containing protein [Candidatus Thiodiazotropha sp. DIVDIV]
MNRPLLHPCRGFTLIELMLVLVLMGMLFSLTPPLLHKAFPTIKLKAATRDLAQEIRYVQQTAIITGRESKMRFEIENNLYQSDLVNQGEVRHLPDGISFTTQEVADRQQILVLRFYPDGSSSGGLIILGNEAQGFVIAVDWLTSQVKIINSRDLKDDAQFEV